MLVAAVLLVAPLTACSGSSGGGKADSPPPAGDRPGAPTSSPVFKTIMPSVTASPKARKTGCVDAVGATHSGGTSGTVLAVYTDFRLPAGQSIPFEAGATPQPTAQCNNYDLGFDGNSSFSTSPGGLADIHATMPSFQECVGVSIDPNTDFAATVPHVATGQSMCFVGHGVVAGMTVLYYGGSGSAAYALIDVIVWNN